MVPMRVMGGLMALGGVAMCHSAWSPAAAGEEALAREEARQPALASTAARLAPGPAEWETTLVEAEGRVGRAEALSVAALRLQNAWADQLASGLSRPCRDPVARAIGARLVPFGDAWRDAVQSARVQSDRVERMRRAPTVAPLLDEGADARVQALIGRLNRQVRAYGEARAWHQRHVTSLAECGSPEPGPGLPSPRAWTPDAGPVAVLALAGGAICPEARPADGRVVLLDGDACWSAEGCGCEPGPLTPGTVLGPMAPPPDAPPGP